jgi:hypothetical protein
MQFIYEFKVIKKTHTYIWKTANVKQMELNEHQHRQNPENMHQSV